MISRGQIDEAPEAAGFSEVMRDPPMSGREGFEELKRSAPNDGGTGKGD